MNNLNNNVIHVMYILQELEYQYIRVERATSLSLIDTQAATVFIDGVTLHLREAIKFSG